MIMHGSEPRRSSEAYIECAAGRLCPRCASNTSCESAFKKAVIPKSAAPAPTKLPDLTKYTVEKREEIGSFTIAWVRYHEVKPYDGLKLMVYSTIELAKSEKQKRVDPHFLPWHPSPLARFEPTSLGDWMAHKLVDVLMGKMV